MPLSARELSIGLVLIVVGLVTDIAAGYALPTPPTCNTLRCNIAAGVGLIALLLLIVGIGLQIRAFSRARPQASLPNGFQSGATPPPTSPWTVPQAVAIPSASVAPGTSYTGATAPPPSSSSSPTVQCGRCGRTYGVGQFAYCPACGNPLPFAP
ncbi:MAG: hypothetical protein L3J95_04040 [Thermoplasmata archaeon]|nr:hypothetical protein [Thermoplasmata archaeon]MCI4359578.1 hypothetical protein [Thermoplasmata archaeon]